MRKPRGWILEVIRDQVRRIWQNLPHLGFLGIGERANEIHIQLEEWREEMKRNLEVTSDAEEMAGERRSKPEKSRRPRGEEPAASGLRRNEERKTIRLLLKTPRTAGPTAGHGGSTGGWRSDLWIERSDRWMPELTTVSAQDFEIWSICCTLLQVFTQSIN